MIESCSNVAVCRVFLNNHIKQYTHSLVHFGYSMDTKILNPRDTTWDTQLTDIGVLFSFTLHPLYKMTQWYWKWPVNQFLIKSVKMWAFIMHHFWWPSYTDKTPSKWTVHQNSKNILKAFKAHALASYRKIPLNTCNAPCLRGTSIQWLPDIVLIAPHFSSYGCDSLAPPLPAFPESKGGSTSMWCVPPAHKYRFV